MIENSSESRFRLGMAGGGIGWFIGVVGFVNAVVRSGQTGAWTDV
jgi:hypothetical protein